MAEGLGVGSVDCFSRNFSEARPLRASPRLRIRCSFAFHPSARMFKAGGMVVVQVNTAARPRERLIALHADHRDL